MCVRTFTCTDCGVKHESHGRRGRVALRCKGCKKRNMMQRRQSQPPKVHELRCEFCCRCFSASHHQRRFCAECLPIFKPPAELFSCQECGKPFTRADVGGKTFLKYCSRQCSGLARSKHADRERQLRQAAGPAGTGRDQLFKMVRRAVRMFSSIYKSISKNDCTHKTTCTTCGCVIVCQPQHVGGNRYCSRACNPKKKGTKNHAVRAKRRGLPRVYWITLRAVCDRDENICQLCGRQTLMMHVDGNGASPSIDHVVPLGHPGNHVHGHVWNNVQLACRDCNEKKNARLEHDSLLFATDPRECVAAIRQRQGRIYA